MVDRMTVEEMERAGKVVRALREGLGVEDIRVLGIDTEQFARKTISRLRDNDLLRNLYPAKTVGSPADAQSDHCSLSTTGRRRVASSGFFGGGE